MSIDVRFRVDGEHAGPADPATFFEADLPAALRGAEGSQDDALAWLDPAPLTVEVGDEAWHLVAHLPGRRPGRITVHRGRHAEGSLVRCTPEQVRELAIDQSTFMAFLTHGTLDQPRGRLEHLLDWWLLLRGALDARPVHVPGALRLTERDGSPLDLTRPFTLDDDPDDQRHFLGQAGFLHLRGVFTDGEMAEVSADIDRYASHYQPGDQRSWWATTHDGDERLVRMHQFQQYSAAMRALLADPRLDAVRLLPRDGHLPSDWCQALIKPIGIVSGISDVPWHKDCSLGRHSYDCCSMIVGISVTGADAVSGQLRVVPGSHRVLVWPAFLRKGTGLGELDLPTRTGDVTVHLSCTLHMSQPPVERERRVVYCDFRLPAPDASTAAAERDRVFAIRKGIPDGLSQKPAVPAGA